MVYVRETYIPFTQDSEQEEFTEKTSPFTEIIFEMVDSAKTAILIVLLLFTFVFRMVGVDGSSMVPTLDDGNWLAVSAVSGNVERGDIVVITQPWSRNVPIIKRVIGVSGDVVDIDFSNAVVRVNGEKLNEEYILEPTRLSYDVIFPVIVPKGTVFVMGDNRNDSLDSRSSEIGFIEENYILGKTMFRFYPFSRV